MTSGIHADAVGALKRKKPSWAGLPEPKHRLALCLLSQVGAAGWVWLPSCYPDPQCTSVLRRSDLSPAA